MRLGKRLKLARERRGNMTQEKLAELASTADMPITQAAISALESRDSETTTYLFAFSRALQINPEWLQTGIGESGLDVDAWKPTPELDPDESALLDDYRQSIDLWKLTIRLIARAAPHQQQELSHDINMLMARIFGKDVTPIADARVRDSLITSRHGYPPGLHEPDSPGYKKK